MVEGGLHVIGEKVFQLKNESSIQEGGAFKYKQKKKNVGMFYMCRQCIQHNFEVGQYNKPFRVFLFGMVEGFNGGWGGGGGGGGGGFGGETPKERAFVC
jgi:hypothetical protein